MTHTVPGSAGSPAKEIGGPVFRPQSSVRRSRLPALVLMVVAISMLVGCSVGSTTKESTTSTTESITSTSGEVSGTTASTAAPDGGLGPGSGVETEAKRLSPDSGPFVICQDCHTYLDPPDRPRAALNGAFGHENHLARSAPCTACHESPVHTETVVRRPTMAICYQCHGSGPDSVAPDDCSLCHPPDFQQLPTSHDDAFYKGSHSKVVAANGVEECFVCHQAGDVGFCRACHGLDLPHPPGWALDLEGGPGAHVDAAHKGAAVCVRCHENRGPAPAGCYGGECHGV